MLHSRSGRVLQWRAMQHNFIHETNVSLWDHRQKIWYFLRFSSSLWRQSFVYLLIDFWFSLYMPYCDQNLQYMQVIHMDVDAMEVMMKRPLYFVSVTLNVNTLLWSSSSYNTILYFVCSSCWIFFIFLDAVKIL